MMKSYILPTFLLACLSPLASPFYISSHSAIALQQLRYVKVANSNDNGDVTTTSKLSCSAAVSSVRLCPAGTLHFYRHKRVVLYQSSQNNIGDDQNDNDDDDNNVAQQQQVQDIEYQLSLIAAIEERNQAQLDSFVDAQDQWDSMDQGDQDLLNQKQQLQDRLESLVSTL